MSKLTIKEFCDQINISQKQYYDIVNFCKQNKGYYSFKIPKKSGGERIIFAPFGKIKFLQTKIKEICKEKYNPLRCCHGFIDKRSCITNASCHVNKKWCFNFDLADFFPSINFGRVLGLFKSDIFNYDNKLATTLAIICCYDKKIPQGAPSSPIIANMISYSLDKNLIEIAKNNRCIYSRYVDDMTLSTNLKSFPKTLVHYDRENKFVELSYQLNEIILKSGFRVNPLKTRLSNNTKCQMVTGIVVNKKLNLKRKYYRTLRAILYNCRKEGLQKTAIKNNKANIKDLKKFILGKMSYYKSIVGNNHSSYNTLCKMYNKNVEYYYKECRYTIEELIDNSLFIIENDSSQGTAFLVNNKLYTCKHCVVDITKKYTPDELLIELNLSQQKFNVFKYTNPDKKYKVKNIRLFDSDIAEMEIVDYNTYISFKFSDNCNINIGEEYKLIGFPNYSPGSTSNIQTIKVAGRRLHFGLQYYTIDKCVVSGSSGGPIINSSNEVIGIATNGAKHIQEAVNTDANMFYSILDVKKTTN